MIRNRMMAFGMLVLLIASAFGCAPETKTSPEDCIPSTEPPKKVEVTSLGRIPAMEDPDAEWCRACVMSTGGFASCQRVMAKAPGEDRIALKTRATEKACEDAGFPPNGCPAQAIISAVCKGDPPPEGTTTAGKALQNMFIKMGGPPPGDATKAAPDDRRGKTDAAGNPIIQ